MTAAAAKRVRPGPTANDAPATSAETPATNEALATVSDETTTISEVPATSLVDNYEKFVADQKKRELEWTANRAAKRAKVNNSTQQSPIEKITLPDGDDKSADQLSRLQTQLDAKSDECCRLTSKLVKLQEENAQTVRNQLETQERLYKVSLFTIIVFILALAQITSKKN